MVSKLGVVSGCLCLLGNLPVSSSMDIDSTRILGGGVSNRANQKRGCRLDSRHDLHGIEFIVHDYEISEPISRVVGRVVFEDE